MARMCVELYLRTFLAFRALCLDIAVFLPVDVYPYYDLLTPHARIVFIRMVQWELVRLGSESVEPHPRWLITVFSGKFLGF
jgi:hypothetical protein